jgi:hypothetical protein
VAGGSRRVLGRSRRPGAQRRYHRPAAVRGPGRALPDGGRCDREARVKFTDSTACTAPPLPGPGGTMSSSTDPAPAAPERGRLVDRAYRQIRDAIVAVRLQPGAPLDEQGPQRLPGIGAHPDPRCVEATDTGKAGGHLLPARDVRLPDQHRRRGPAHRGPREARGPGGIPGRGAGHGGRPRNPAPTARGPGARQRRARRSHRARREGAPGDLRRRSHDFLESTLSQYANLAWRI